MTPRAKSRLDETYFCGLFRWGGGTILVLLLASLLLRGLWILATGGG